MAEDDPFFRGGRYTALNAIQALGRGFDVSCDIRLLYCKGNSGSRLIRIDEDHKKDLELPEGLRVPNVSVDIKGRAERCARQSLGVLDFKQMSEVFNKNLSIPGNTPSGMFNAMFNFSGSWKTDASLTKSLAVDGWVLPLYSLNLKDPFILCDEVKQAVPPTWNPVTLASFIGRYGTHIIKSIEIGGKDVIYVKQLQSSNHSKSEIETYLKNLVKIRFEGVKISTSGADYKDITVICRRRGGDDLAQDHYEWRNTIRSNPDVISMSFEPIASLLGPGMARNHLQLAIELYLKYKPPQEELQYFLDFQVPRAWAPISTQVSIPRKEPVCPALQFSLMGPKLYINTNQISVGRKLVTGLRLSLEGSKANRLAVHVQHLVVLPKVLQPHWDAYITIGAPKWHGPEEQDSRWFEPVQWKKYSHVSTAPIEISEMWFEDVSVAYVVTGAQLGVWDFGLKSVLYLKLLYLKVPGCTIRRSVWDHTPASSSQSSNVKLMSKKEAPATVSAAAVETQKLLKFVNTAEIMRGPEDLPGHWLVTGAKLGVEKSNIFVRAKYSLLNY